MEDAKEAATIDAPMLFALGFLAAWSQLMYSPDIGFGRYLETMALARSLAGTGSFADPFSSAPTGPTAHLPPLYPALLALALRIFGDGPGTAMPLLIMGACFHGLHAALLPPVAARLLGKRQSGTVAAILSSLIPVLRFQPQWEAIIAADGVMVFYLLADWAFRPPAGKWRMIATGSFWGLLLLLNPAIVLIIIPLLVWFSCSRRFGPKSLALVFLLASLVCVPWFVRNYAVLGETGFIRSNLGLEFYVSNNQCAKSSLFLNAASGCHLQTHPGLNPNEAAELKRLGEPTYNRQRLCQAFDWIRNHPRSFMHLTMQRALEFWWPNPSGFRPFAYGIWVVTLLSLLGLYRLSRERPRAAILLCSILLLYSPLYYLLQSDMRYRYPVFWISLIVAGYFLVALRGGIRSSAESMRIYMAS